MRDKKRIKPTIKDLEKIWLKHPNLRLGQLIGNAVSGTMLYYIEDGDLMDLLKEVYEL